MNKDSTAQFHSRKHYGTLMICGSWSKDSLLVVKTIKISKTETV